MLISATINAVMSQCKQMLVITYQESCRKTAEFDWWLPGQLFELPGCLFHVLHYT
jgi:hypothetical protein